MTTSHPLQNGCIASVISQSTSGNGGFICTMLADPDLTQYLMELMLEGPFGCQTLSRLSRTCKALHDPAISVLWRQLESTQPFVDLFPHTPLPVKEDKCSFFSEEVPPSGAPPTPPWYMRLLRTVASLTWSNRKACAHTKQSGPLEWPIVPLPLKQPSDPVPPPYWELTAEARDRILSYGRRICSIAQTEPSTPQLEDVLAYLTSTVQMKQEVSLLLPSLESLDWSCSPSDIERSAPFFLQPSLRQLGLELLIDAECDLELALVLSRIAALQHMTHFNLSLLPKPGMQVGSRSYYPFHPAPPRSNAWEDVRISIQLANTIGQLPSSFIGLLRWLPALPRLRTLHLDLSYSRMDGDLRMLFPVQRPSDSDDDLFDALFWMYPEPVTLLHFMHLRELALGPVPLREAVPLLYRMSSPLEKLQLILVRSRSHSADDALESGWRGFCRVLASQFLGLHTLIVEECAVARVMGVRHLDCTALSALQRLQHIRLEMHSGTFDQDVHELWPSAQSVDVHPLSKNTICDTAASPVSPPDDVDERLKLV